MRRPPALALLVLAALLPACQSNVDKTGQHSEGFYVPSYDTLWDVTRQELNRAGFTADLEASNKAGRVMVSRWGTHLMPFSMKGWREQATVTIHPVDGRENYWSVEANVIRQNNKTTREPMNPAMADWTDGERDEAKEQRIVYAIERFFMGDDVSERFRMKYGMPAGHEPVKATPPAPDTKGGESLSRPPPRSKDPLAR